MRIKIYKKKYKIKHIKKTNNYTGNIQFGTYGLKAMESSIFLSQELEAIRRMVSRLTKRLSKVLIRVFFSQPITKKPLKSRMGKGVGVLKYWVSLIKKGMILFEISYISKNLASLVFKAINPRISLKVSFVAREIYKK